MTKYIITVAILLQSIFASAQVAITIPAEYEKSEKLLLTWPYDSVLDSVYAELIGIAQEVTKVNLIYHPDSILPDTSFIRNFLTNIISDSLNIEFIPGYTNTNWVRQYSPVTGYGVFTDSLVRYMGNPGFDNYFRPADDSIPGQLANFWEMDLATYGLRFENTNIQYDGMRYLFVGDRIIEDNFPMDQNAIKFSLNAYFNSGEVMFVPTPENLGGGSLNSINNYLKILDFETIIIASIPDTLSDYLLLEDIAAQLSETTNYFGTNFNVIRIPAAPNDNGVFTTDHNGEFRSYTNSLILNNLVMLPSFNLPDYDSVAKIIYSEILPGYNIQFIDAAHLTVNHGGIHTITKEIPQTNYLRIEHKKMIGVQEFYPEVNIVTLCGAGNQLENMWLYYKINDDTTFIKKQIQLVCPQYFAVIDKLTPQDTIHYYIEAISSTTTTTYPLSAPQGNFTFWFDVVSEVDDPEKEKQYTISPNPSKGIFKVHNSQHSQEEIKISVFNPQGLLINKTVSLSDQFINLEKILGNGFYTVIIENNNLISKSILIISK